MLSESFNEVTIAPPKIAPRPTGISENDLHLLKPFCDSVVDSVVQSIVVHIAVNYHVAVINDKVMGEDGELESLPSLEEVSNRTLPSIPSDEDLPSIEAI